MLRCFWLIGTTLDCHQVPHKNDFHKRDKIIKGEKPNTFVYTCCPMQTKQKKIQQTLLGANIAFIVITNDILSQ